MKTARTFTIDVPIAERLLHLDNQSDVVNKLLKEYFEIKGDRSTLLDEKQAVLRQMAKKKDSFPKTLRLLLSSIRSGLIILLDDGLKLVGKSRKIKKSDPMLEGVDYLMKKQ